MPVTGTAKVDLPTTYYRAIGEIIARFNLLEHLTMVAISMLLRIENKKQQRIVLMGMTAKGKFGTLKALATHWSPNHRIKAEMHEITKIATNLYRWRNRFAHGWWVDNPRPRPITLLFADEGKDYYMPKGVKLTSQQVRRIASSIRTLTIRLDKVITAIRNEQATNSEGNP